MNQTGIVEREMDTPELLTLDGGEACVFSCPSPAKVSGNEDSAGVFPGAGDSCLLVVADGIGGYANGASASAHVILSLQEAVHNKSQNGQDSMDNILLSLEQSNRDLVQRVTGEGTTVALAQVTGRHVRTCHVGDSDILVTGQRGKIKFQTVAHSPVGEALAAGLINEKQAVHHEDRHFISNFVGHPDMFITVGDSIELAEHDTLILASDGLFDNLYREEIVNIARRRSLVDAATQLATLARQRMHRLDRSLPSKPDDLTFILYRPGN